MLRKFSVILTVALAMLLSVVLAVPASAADPFVPDPLKTATNTKFHWGFDYYKPTTTGTPAGPVSSYPRPVPLSPVIHPSAPGGATGGSYYLNQYKTRALNPANVPLTGKIIEPGKTLVRAPSTYVSAGRAITGGVLARALGAATVGIGGTSIAPSNGNELALSQGVSAGCVSGTQACTPAEINKRFMIDACGQLSGASSCDSIGAVGSDGQSLQKDWWKDSALPFLADMWAKLTGQTSDTAPSDRHISVTLNRGCYRNFGINSRGDNNFTVVPLPNTVVSPRPTESPQREWYDNACGPARVADPTSSAGSAIKATCVDSKGSSIVSGAPGYIGSNGSSYGRNLPMGGDFIDTSTGWNKIAFCDHQYTAAENLPLRLVTLEIYNQLSQNDLNTQAAAYSATNYVQWLNPDSEVDTIEDTKITTNWECQTSDGVTYQFSKSIAKVGAFVSPDCPPGSVLVKHEIKSSTADGNSKTVDSGGTVPAELAKYPDCGAGSPGCALSVYIDGSVCTSSRSECQTWPAVAGVNPSRVDCKWGGYKVPVSDCYSISNGYKSETGVVFDPNSGTWVAIDVYGNPVAPNPEPWNPTNPNPTPGVSPGTPTTTTPGTGTDTPGFPTTGTSPSDNCVSPAWSWNPVDWVKNPVVCALQDAFVPKLDVQARSDQLKTLALDTAPLSWINPAIVGPGGSGCPDWNVVIPGAMSKNVVCDSSFTAALVGVRGPMFGLITVAMVWPLLRSIWYAAIPVLRVSPSSSK